MNNLPKPDVPRRIYALGEWFDIVGIRPTSDLCELEYKTADGRWIWIRDNAIQAVEYGKGELLKEKRGGSRWGRVIGDADLRDIWNHNAAVPPTSHHMYPDAESEKPHTPVPESV